MTTTMTPDLLAVALKLSPGPVDFCHVCETEHWRCIWCLRHDQKTQSGRGGKILPSGWEQMSTRSGWSTLCARCAAKRMRNPWNALIMMRIRGTHDYDRIANCRNVREPDGEICTGRLVFAWGDAQAKCGTCGAWCGALVADYEDPAISAKNARILTAIDQACASAALDGIQISKQWRDRVARALEKPGGGIDQLIVDRIAEVQVSQLQGEAL